ncbi:hypothetical protein XPA_010247 [Xanthoria parietina]
MAASRILRASLPVLLCALLFFTSSHFSGKKSRTSVRVVNRQQQQEVEPTRQHLVALPFGHPKFAATYSSPKSSWALTKRVSPTFEQARNKGEDFYTVYQSRFTCGGRPGTVFTDDQFEDAWSDVEGRETSLSTHWQQALNLPSSPTDLVATDAVQNIAPFVSAAGGQATVATGAFYQMQYIPSAAAIIALDTKSPDYKVGRLGVPKAARPAAIPELNRLSDVMWYTWDLLASSPANLRFIGQDTVTNGVSAVVIDEILERAGSPDAPWPGKTFALDTDEGLALLGIPNGVAVAWLLLDRYRTMGERDPTVTIWRLPGNRARMMLWDLQPVG